MEERIAKLEQILHKLFCCNNSQFTGPQGPQGPTGIGIQGPPGVPGAVGPAGLNWQGVWTSGVVYLQNDAVSYNGSSYFLNCESTEGFEDESPLDNSCWVLLANQGAIGPQGPTGGYGNDGSNSGRWMLAGTGVLGDNPGSTYFTVDTLDLSVLSNLIVSFDDINSTSYQGWWEALFDFANDYNPLIFVQITEVGSNDIIGIYSIGIKVPLEDITLQPSWVEIGLTPVYVGNAIMNVGNVYTISWSIHGGVNGSNAPKTEGIVTPVFQPGPYPILEYDYNELNIQPVVTAGTQYFAALPTPIFIGQTLVVRVLGTALQYDRSPGIISHNGTAIINLNFVLTDTFTTYNQSCIRFTWAGNYWVSENIQGYGTLFNGFKTLDSGYDIIETTLDSTTDYPTKAYLNANYTPTFYPRGIKIYCPNIPGGPKVFTKISNPLLENEWASYPYTPVI
jgi:hypothetical protein